MFGLGTVLVGLGVVLQNVLWVYSIVLFATAVVSWLSADPRNPVVRFLHSATDPLLRIIRRMLPSNLRYFPIDVAFLVLFALVLFAQFAIAQPMIELGVRLRRPLAAEPM